MISKLFKFRYTLFFVMNQTYDSWFFEDFGYIYITVYWGLTNVRQPGINPSMPIVMSTTKHALQQVTKSKPVLVADSTYFQVFW